VTDRLQLPATLTVDPDGRPVVSVALNRITPDIAAWCTALSTAGVPNRVASTQDGRVEIQLYAARPAPGRRADADITEARVRELIAEANRQGQARVRRRPFGRGGPLV
jgi:hypothetical protein